MSNYDEERWNKRFEKNKSYIELLIGIEKFVDDISKEEYPMDYFTPHDHSHCLAVEKIVKALIEKSNIQLSELELFILFVAVWTHDIGMIGDIAREYLDQYNIQYSPIKKRDLHHIISAWFLNKEQSPFNKIFKNLNIPDDLYRAYVHTINIISKYHRRKEDINQCIEERYIKGEKIRSRLLSCLVRLGDTLHVDSSRYDRKLYNILQIGNFDRTARLHWLKSYVVSSIHLDIERQTIFVSIDLPEPEDKDEFAWEENARRLEFIIYEDVMAVTDTFRKYNFPFYDRVKSNITYCPGYQKDKREEIIGILNDLDIVLSPNTTAVIRKSLDSISSLIKIPFKNYDHFYNQTKGLRKYNFTFLGSTIPS